MRVLTIIGESTKYLSPHLKAADPTIPWKNIEKVRDLLGHVSRVPIREAVQSILEEREVRGANLAEDATVVTSSSVDKEQQQQTNAASPKTETEQNEKKAKADVKTAKRGVEEESTFERAVIQLPPNLLRDVYEEEFVALTRKFEDLQRYHSSFLIAPAPASSSHLRIVCAAAVVFVTFYLFSSLLLTFVVTAALGGAIALSAKPSTTPAARRTRDANSLWQALPQPAVYSQQSLTLKRYAKLLERGLEEKLRRQRDASHETDGDGDEVKLMLRELADAMGQKQREAAVDNDNCDGDQAQGAESVAEGVQIYRRALRGEGQLDKAQAKALWALITDKSARKRWAELLYGKSRATKRVKPKAPAIDGDDVADQEGHNAASNSGQRHKLARMRRLVELHQNSTLNKEGKRHHELRKFVLLRKFLQNPTKTKEDQSTLCVKFIIATLREVQQLMADELPAFLAWTLEQHRLRATDNGPRAASGGVNEYTERDSNADEEKRRQAFADATLLIRERPLLQYALHFQIGIYALYAAQVRFALVPALVRASCQQPTPPVCR
jgi:hypothetical protein